METQITTQARETTSRPTLQLNGQVPDFDVDTTHGRIRFHDWKKGKWAILFSHPADFTPVCTTELMAFARREPELRQRDVLLLGCSVDSVFSHIAWVRNIKERFDVDIGYPIVADLDQKVARLYGMVHEASSSTATVRALFVVDPKNVLRAMIYYPMNIGRNFDEIVRVVEALQTADRHGVACPADWRPGEEVIVPPPGTVEGAARRLNDANLTVTDWYFSRKKV